MLIAGSIIAVAVLLLAVARNSEVVLELLAATSGLMVLIWIVIVMPIWYPTGDPVPEFLELFKNSMVMWGGLLGAMSYFLTVSWRKDILWVRRLAQ